MLHTELEAKAKRSFTVDQYNLINSLYSETNLSQTDFIKSMKKVFQAMPEQVEKKILTMAVRNKIGDYRTPNGCWLNTVKVTLEDVSIATGKVTVKVIPNTYDNVYECDFYEGNEKYTVIK